MLRVLKSHFKRNLIDRFASVKYSFFGHLNNLGLYVLLGRLVGLFLQAVAGGSVVTNPFMVTEVYIKEDGKWRMGSLTFSHLPRAVKMNK
jgi:hypothetical protein